MASEQFTWKRMRRFQPLFFIFLIAGPIALLAFCVIAPGIVTLRAAWNKRPRFWWRLATIIFISFGFSVSLWAALPDGWAAPSATIGYADHGPLFTIIETQLRLLIGCFVFLIAISPLSLISTRDTLKKRRRQTTK